MDMHMYRSGFYSKICLKCTGVFNRQRLTQFKGNELLDCVPQTVNMYVYVSHVLLVYL